MPDGDNIRIGRNNVASNPGAQTILRRAASSTRTEPVFTVQTPVGGDGIHGESASGTGIKGTSTGDPTVGFGVHGISDHGTGVKGEASADDVAGVHGDSTSGDGVGVLGTNTSNGAGVAGECASGAGVGGRSTSGIGVNGSSESGIGTNGFSSTSTGVRGESDGTGDSGIGVDGFTRNGAVGVKGTSFSGAGVDGTGAFSGVRGTSTTGDGVDGTSSSGDGVVGTSETNFGVRGHSNSETGVMGTGGLTVPPGTQTRGYGVFGIGTNFGVKGEGNSGIWGSTSGSATPSSAGVHGTSDARNANGVIGVANTGGAAHGVWGISTSGYAGYFSGKVHVEGDLTKGGGGFRIDHPLDAENKYLQHSFVESPDMKNLYDGTCRLDDNGSAWIELPEWFGELNRDYRYQLTAIGGPAPDLHIAEEVSENRFRIAGGTAGMKVSWQVTGIRKDPWAEMNRLVVEEDKPEEARGTVLHPEAFGLSETRGEGYARKRALRSRLAEMSEARPPADEEEL